MTETWMTTNSNDELLWMLATLNERLSAVRAAELSTLGLTPTQADVLRAIGRHRQLTAQEIATELGHLRIPSRIIYSQVLAGFISESTNAEDRREKLYELTANGRARLKNVRTVDRRIVKGEFLPLDEEQIRSMGDSVETLLVTEDE